MRVTWRPDLSRDHIISVATVAALLGLMVTVLVVIVRVSAPVAGSASRGSDSHLPPPPVGEVESRVHNVFGDPVSGAVVSVGDRKVRTDERGYFYIDSLLIGAYDMRIAAPGYHTLTRSIQVDEGPNAPRIKYEIGLWPTQFTVDFHVFFTKNDSGTKLFGEIGLANGTDKSVYIHGFKVLGPQDETIQDVLSDTAGLEQFATYYSQTTVTFQPSPAVILPPLEAVTRIEMQPQGEFEATDVYTVVIEFGHRTEHEKGEYETLTVHASPLRDDDWNPHSP